MPRPLTLSRLYFRILFLFTVFVCTRVHYDGPESTTLQRRDDEISLPNRSQRRARCHAVCMQIWVNPLCKHKFARVFASVRDMATGPESAHLIATCHQVPPQWHLFFVFVPRSAVGCRRCRWKIIIFCIITMHFYRATAHAHTHTHKNPHTATDHARQTKRTRAQINLHILTQKKNMI